MTRESRYSTWKGKGKFVYPQARRALWVKKEQGEGKEDRCGYGGAVLVQQADPGGPTYLQRDGYHTDVLTTGVAAETKQVPSSNKRANEYFDHAFCIC